MNEKQKQYLDSKLNAKTPSQRYAGLRSHANRVANFLSHAQGLLQLLPDTLGEGPSTINAQGARELLNAMGYNLQDALHAVFAVSHYLTSLTGVPVIKVGGYRGRAKASKRSNVSNEHARKS